MMQKTHHMFDECVCLSMDIPHTIDCTYSEMNEDLFFSNFPKKEIDAYKGSYGKSCFISGSYGQAGAAILNLIGANTVGASYKKVMCPQDVYPIIASKDITSVYYPFNENNWERTNRSSDKRYESDWVWQWLYIYAS